MFNLSVARGSRTAMAALAVLSCSPALDAAAWESNLGHGEAGAVAVDAADNVLAAGLVRSTRSTTQAFEDIAVTKHSGSDGAILWTAIVHGDDNRRYSDDQLHVLRLTAGNVLLGGRIREASSDGRFAVVALDHATGAEEWRYAQSLHPEFGSGEIERVGGHATDLVVDSSGDVLAAGRRRSFFRSVGTTDINEGMLVKLDGSTGAELWRRSVVGTTVAVPPAPASLAHVVLAPDEDPIVGGSVHNVGSGSDCVLARYDAADGSEVWREEFSFSSQGGESIENLHVDPTGNLIARCAPWILKIDVSDGSLLWQQDLGTLGVPTMDTALTSTGDVIVGGSEAVGPGDLDAAVIRLSGVDGTEVWRTVLPGLGADVAKDLSEDSLAVEVDGNASVFLASRSHSRSTGEDAQVHKLDAVSGAVLWSQILADSQRRKDGPAGYLLADLALDSAGDLAFAGRRAPGSYVAGKLDGGDGSLHRPVAARRFVLETFANPALRFDGKDPGIAPIVAGTSGDPTLFGATLTLHNPATLETTIFNLPAVNWWRLDSVSGRGNYRYADKTQASGPCVAASQKAGQFSVECAGPQVDFTLDEASQGSLAAILSIGSAATRYCTLLDGASIRRDEVGVFVAKGAAATLDCPVLP